MHADHAQRVREIERKLERGWITLEEILMLSAGSPIHLDEATELGRRAGLRMTEGGEGDVWEDIEKLADEGQSAFTEPVREGPAAADDLAMGDPTSLYFREISRLHLLTADEEVMLAKQIEAGRAATEQLADLPPDDPNRRELEALGFELGDPVPRGELGRLLAHRPTLA
jgi:RNA polymerase primary sigma factor